MDGLRMLIATLVIIVLAQAGVGSGSIPKLISPLDGTVMDNERTDRQDSEVWDFNWSDVEGATQYQLYVKGINVPLPVIDTITSSSSYTRIDRGYSGSPFTWKVRAYVNGQWGEWSEIRNFQVEKVDTDPISLPPFSTTTPVSTYTPSATPQLIQNAQQQDSRNWGLLGGILAVLAIGIVVLSMRRRGHAPRPVPEKPIREGTDILDAGYVLSKKASSLFNKRVRSLTLKDINERIKSEVLTRVLQPEVNIVEIEDIYGNRELQFKIENEVELQLKQTLEMWGLELLKFTSEWDMGDYN